VRLQRYKEKGLSDVKTFKGADGLTWIDTAGRSFTLTLKELASWRGERGAAGRIRPDRFLTNNKFGAPAPANGGKNVDKNDNKNGED
jgi:topoisomerase IV subunit A